MMQHAPSINIGEMIFHHTGDAHELDFSPIGVIHLPRWEPLHLGSLTIDLSPTKLSVFVVLAAVITFVMMRAAAVGIHRAHREGRAPRGYAAFMEMFVLWVREEIAISNIGREMGPFYAPLIMSFFFFILVCNLLGLFPWGSTPSGNLAVTGSLALISFVAIEVGGMVKLGFKGYLGTIFPHLPGLSPGMGRVMSVAMAPIEIMSKLVKPFALMVRLFGNLTAGHFVILAMFGVVFLFGHLGVFSWGIGIVTALIVLGVMMIELIVAALQAYVFALLTAVFIGLMQHEH